MSVRDYLCVWREPAISPLASVPAFALSFAVFGDQGHCVAGMSVWRRRKWLEVSMQTSRKEMRGSKAFTVPLFGIVVLLGCYWLLVEWQHLPALINSVLTAVHWIH
jgi:hypothetical protein